MTLSTIVSSRLETRFIADKFGSIVQRNAQILAEELRQSSRVVIALRLDVFGNAGRFRNRNAIGLKVPGVGDNAYSHFFHVKNK